MYYTLTLNHIIPHPSLCTAADITANIHRYRARDRYNDIITYVPQNKGELTCNDDESNKGERTDNNNHNSWLLFSSTSAIGVVGFNIWYTSSSAALVNRNLQGRAAAEEEKLFVLVRPPKNKFHQIMRHLQCATSEGNNFSGPAISLRALWREYSRIPIQLHLSIKFSRLDLLRGHREFFSYCLLPKKRRRSRTQEKICTLA